MRPTAINAFYLGWTMVFKAVGGVDKNVYEVYKFSTMWLIHALFPSPRTFFKRDNGDTSETRLQLWQWK